MHRAPRKRSSWNVGGDGPRLCRGGELTDQVLVSDPDGRGVIWLVGVTSLGDYILLPPVRFQPTSGTLVERRTYPYLQVSADGTEVTDAPIEHWMTVLEGATATGSPIFAPRALAGVADDRLVEALVDTAGIRVRSVAGRLLREARWPGAAPRIEDGDVDAYIALNAGSPQEAAAAREAFLGVPGLISEVAPVHDQLFVDPERTVWLRRTVLVAGGMPETWDVVDLDGRYLGPLELPGRFVPHDAGPGWVLGVETDELGVEEVRLYSLERGG
jgi:hypothetical protein